MNRCDGVAERQGHINFPSKRQWDDEVFPLLTQRWPLLLISTPSDQNERFLYANSSVDYGLIRKDVLNHRISSAGGSSGGPVLALEYRLHGVPSPIDREYVRANQGKQNIRHVAGWNTSKFGGGSRILPLL